MGTTINPLEAERERLRREGWSDAEIQNIVMQREILRSASPSMQPVGAPVQGVMTGVLGNASAVLSHARATIPIIEGHVANARNPKASRDARVRSTLKLVGVAVIVAALGYAIYQEWQIHIVYETEIKRLNVALTEAQALTAKAQAGIAVAQAAADLAIKQAQFLTAQTRSRPIFEDNSSPAFAAARDPVTGETLEERIARIRQEKRSHPN